MTEDPKMFNIRTALPKDAAQIADCQKKNFSIPLPEPAVLKFENDPLFKVRVIEENGRPAGHSVTCIIGDVAELLTIAVEDEFRGKGYGEALVKDVLDSAKASGCTAVLLDVRVSNSKAIALYTKLGFVKIAQRKDFYQRPREDGFTMQAVTEQQSK